MTYRCTNDKHRLIGICLWSSILSRVTDKIRKPPRPLLQTGNGRHGWCIVLAHGDDDSIEILHCPSVRFSTKTCKKGGAHFGPPGRSVRVTLGRHEGPGPESPTLLLPSFVDSLLDMFDAGVISDCGVLIIAIDVEIGSIGSNVVANLIMRQFWCPK